MAANSPAYPTPAALIGAAVVTSTSAFLLAANEASTSAALLVSTTCGLVTGIVLHRPRSGGPGRDGRLTFRTPDQLRDARARLVDARRVHADNLKERQAVRRRLLDLLGRMREIGLSAYSTRITTIERGLGTLDRQIDVIAKLRDGYDRSIRMIDIELEAGHAAELLDDDIGFAIADAMHELRLLEESRADLGRQLEANDEVEGITAGHDLTRTQLR